MASGSTPDRIAVALADMTGRTKEEIKLLGAAAAIAVGGAVVYRVVDWLTELGFDRTSRSQRR